MRPIDLTMTVSEGMPVFPGSPAPQFIPWERLVSDGYNSELAFMSTHTGTHIDAPRHFTAGGMTVERIPPERLISEAILIRVRRRLITKKDITKFESKYDPLPNNPTVVFQTGWSDRPARRDYFGRCPGIAADAARYLVSLSANMVAIDSPSIDAGDADRFTAHHILLRGGVLIVENLTGLCRIKGVHFKLAVMPLKLKGATGSPVRAMAI